MLHVDPLKSVPTLLLIACATVPASARPADNADTENAPLRLTLEPPAIEPPNVPAPRLKDQYPRPAWVVLNYLSFEQDGRAGLRGGTGSVSISRTDASANLIVGPESNFQFSLPFDFETSHYSFRLSDVVPGAKVVQDVASWTIAPNIDAVINEHWSVVTGGFVIWGGEDGVDVSDGLRYGGFLGAKYKFSKTFYLVGGLSGSSRLEDHPDIAPLAGIEWKIDDQWRLVSEGTELRLEYEIREGLTAMLVTSYDVREFRFDENNAIRHGVLRDTKIPVSVAIEYEPHPAVTFGIQAGVVAYEEFIFDDENGLRVGKREMDPAPFVNFSFEFVF